MLAFHFELNFYLLTISKSDLDKVDKANCLLTRPKCNLPKFKKAVIQGIWNLTFNCSRLTLNYWPLTINFETLIQILPIYQLKLRLTTRRWSDDYSTLIETLNSFSGSWLTLIANCKRFFKCSQSSLNSCFTPLCSPKWYFNQVNKTMFQVVPGTAN